MKTCLVFFHFSFCILLCGYFAKYCFILFQSVLLSLRRIAKCQENNNVQALSKKDARAIRKFSGMLKRMHMHTMP